MVATARLDAHQFDRLIRDSVGVALLLSIALLLLRDPLRRWALRSSAIGRVRRHLAERAYGGIGLILARGRPRRPRREERQADARRLRFLLRPSEPRCRARSDRRPYARSAFTKSACGMK